MEREALITVRGEQYYEGVDPDETELVTDGTFAEIDGGWRVCYEETELTGMRGTHTVIELRERSILLLRAGAINATMAFEVGTPHTTLYETPAGTLCVELHTDSLRVRMGEHGGLAEVRYTIAVEHQIVGSNRFRLQVKTKDRGMIR